VTEIPSPELRAAKFKHAAVASPFTAWQRWRWPLIAVLALLLGYLAYRYGI
jgi:choline-glycine betaine transporter